MEKSAWTVSCLSLDCDADSQAEKSNYPAANKSPMANNSKRFLSLENLALSRIQPAQNYLSFEDCTDDSHVCLNSPIVWKTYCKFITSALSSSSLKFRKQIETAYLMEMRERSALIQLSSINALLRKDKEILKCQSEELAAATRSMEILENDRRRLVETRENLQFEETELQNDVDDLTKCYSGSRQTLEEVENEVLNLEKSVSKKTRKMEKYLGEIESKKIHINNFEDELQISDAEIVELEAQIGGRIREKNQLTSAISDSENRLCDLEYSARQKNEEYQGLLKQFDEVKKFNAALDFELSSLQLKIIDQDITIHELEKALKQETDDSEVCHKSKNDKSLRQRLGITNKFVVGLWIATCFVHLLKMIDRRWP